MNTYTADVRMHERHIPRGLFLFIKDTSRDLDSMTGDAPDWAMLPINTLMNLVT